MYTRSIMLDWNWDSGMHLMSTLLLDVDWSPDVRIEHTLIWVTDSVIIQFEYVNFDLMLNMYIISHSYAKAYENKNQSVSLSSNWIIATR